MRKATEIKNAMPHKKAYHRNYPIQVFFHAVKSYQGQKTSDGSPTSNKNRRAL